MAITSRHELSALAQVAGPQITKSELETKALLADMDKIAAQIAATPPDVRMERCAAVLAGLVTPADAEAVRAAYWTRSRQAARRVAVMAGNLPKERAEGALGTFNAFERGRIHIEIERLIADLRQVQKCMNGGHVPGGEGVH